MNFKFISKDKIDSIKNSDLSNETKFKLIADMCRLNTLTMIRNAGSGHIGSSFSSMDLIVWLYFYEMQYDSQNHDVYFSSKGHDVPALYSVLAAKGAIPMDKLFQLRKLNGLDGHPDIKTPGIYANSGSLGMGISKARGIAIAKRLNNQNGRVFVMVGDGELQEGQNYEALRTAVNQWVNNLIVLVDHNKIQSDTWVKKTNDLGDIEKIFSAFNWQLERCNGHDFTDIQNKMLSLLAQTGPKVLIADTVKGFGVSFMASTSKNAFLEDGTYKWHSGAPPWDSFKFAYLEIIDRINSNLKTCGFEQITDGISFLQNQESQKSAKESVASAFGKALVQMGKQNDKIVVLDADLKNDCQLQSFAAQFPNRFFENGISEQDMVSMAGGFALQGLIPIVNSFACFLISRANEQIYANATEGTKIIYASHYAGLTPAAAGKSHQSIRDISLLGAIPSMIVVQPANELETSSMLRFLVESTDQNSAIRLLIGPSPEKINLPIDYKLIFGQGTVLAKGPDALLIGYGPVLLNEALLAAHILADKSINITVMNFPWLNRVDMSWLMEKIKPFKNIFVLDDHSEVGGLGAFLCSQLNQVGILSKKRYIKMGVTEFPECGQVEEVLNYHGLNAENIAKKIIHFINK